jgi:hypothetical protein
MASGSAKNRQLVTERITTSLIPRTVEELSRLQADTGLSKTDLVNRAISLYAFVAEQLAAGRDLAIRDRESGETQLVRIL